MTVAVGSALSWQSGDGREGMRERVGPGPSGGKPQVEPSGGVDEAARDGEQGALEGEGGGPGQVVAREDADRAAQVWAMAASASQAALAVKRPDGRWARLADFSSAMVCSTTACRR